MQNVSVALVIDWLVTYAGAERVVESIINSHPQCDLFSLIDFVEDNQRDFLKGKKAKTSFIQQLPKAKQKYQKYLPFMPLAIEQLDVSSYDVVISSSHCVAKGILTGPDQLHISYVHSPIRYAWDLQHQYLREAGLNVGLKGWLAKWILHKMRMWDYRTANGVDHFIANSHFISRRIKKVYGRDSTVIYPPVAVDDFTLTEKKEDFYFTASRMVPYKRMDLIVEAFSSMPNKKLVVIGDGSEFAKIKSKAGPNIELLGYQSFSVLKDYMQRAKAFVFAAEEDFGITPVEAQACGTPVIAFGKGGVLETVRPLGVDDPTGVFFDEQTCTALCDAVECFEANSSLLFAGNCRKNAEKFSAQRFENEISAFVSEKWAEFTAQKQIVY